MDTLQQFERYRRKHTRRFRRKYHRCFARCVSRRKDCPVHLTDDWYVWGRRTDAIMSGLRDYYGQVRDKEKFWRRCAWRVLRRCKIGQDRKRIPRESLDEIALALQGYFWEVYGLCA